MNTTLSNLSDYLASLLKNTNMKCLTPNKALSGECGFMAANLYAKVEFLYFRINLTNQRVFRSSILKFFNWSTLFFCGFDLMLSLIMCFLVNIRRGCPC